MQYTPALENHVSLRGIALEAEFLSNMVDSVKKFFPDLLEGVSGVFSQFSNLERPKSMDPALRGLEAKIVERLTTVPYDELTRLTIQVPEGFKGPYLPYFERINEALDYREQVTHVAMEDYYILVSSVLTNRNAKISLRDETRAYRELEKSRNDCNKSVMQFFRPANDASLQYPQLVERNEDVALVFVESQRLNKRLQGLKLDDMQNHVARLTSALQLLIDQAQAGDARHISPEVAKNLAIGAHEIASQVEFFSINYFRAMGLQTSVLSFTEKLDKRLF